MNHLTQIMDAVAAAVASVTPATLPNQGFLRVGDLASSGRLRAFSLGLVSLRPVEDGPKSLTAAPALAGTFRMRVLYPPAGPEQGAEEMLALDAGDILTALAGLDLSTCQATGIVPGDLNVTIDDLGSRTVELRLSATLMEV